MLAFLKRMTYTTEQPLTNDNLHALDRLLQTRRVFEAGLITGDEAVAATATAITELSPKQQAFLVISGDAFQKAVDAL